MGCLVILLIMVGDDAGIKDEFWADKLSSPFSARQRRVCDLAYSNEASDSVCNDDGVELCGCPSG